MAKNKEQKCRFCGCTDKKACVVDGIPCHWVFPDICSACMKPGLKIKTVNSRVLLGRWLEIGTEGVLKGRNGDSDYSDNYLVNIGGQYYCLAPYDFKVISPASADTSNKFKVCIQLPPDAIMGSGGSQGSLRER